MAAAAQQDMSERPAKALAYARLVRLPNVFTALADIALGVFVAGRDQISWSIAALAAASACLYCSGMVWNDVFDIEQDARERPFRPLPSGQIAPRTAIFVALTLMAAGWAIACVAGGLAAIIAGALVLAILLYDRWLKRTALGPAGMAACRSLNVLLGMSAAEVPWGLRLHLALVVGIYVAGVTWFARREAQASDVTQLRLAAIIVLAALALALPLPLQVSAGTASPLFPYLLVAFGCVIGWPMNRAIQKPEPGRVQRAVKGAVLGVIGLDAVLATAISGTYGLAILALLPPAIVLGWRIYST